ncbi:MAG: hypothetical protein Q8908_13805 [Bacteroidota bacterium]|nr:hypothetical protein [Bacteroidota bacterium]
MKKHLPLDSYGLRRDTIQKKDAVNIITGISKFLIIFLSLIFSSGRTNAVPSYARQTGMSCRSCHYSFPELTAFGRQFKMNGYTLTFMKTIEAKDDSSKSTKLNLLSYLPLSAMVQTSFTQLASDIKGVQNHTVAFPQQLSMFFSGEVTPHLGTFIQMTYDGQSFGMDNADIRLTNTSSLGSKSITYGLTVNNNPAVQDVWNTSPAWRFPSATSAAAVNPAKSADIESLGMQVAGLGAYALYNDWLFAELTLYRSAQQGATNPADTTSFMALKGLTPYWRLALQHQWSSNYMEIGTFGMAPRHFQQGITGEMDNFIDWGFDFQYEHTMSYGTFTLHTSLITETEKRDISSNQYDKLNFNSFKIDGNLYLKNGLGATLGYFTKSGSQDVKVGSLTNKPDSRGYIFQLEYLPWFNTKLTLQYIVYNRFDGSVKDYNGIGRNANHNNTLYILAWINF